jgi:hypothetical protein
MSLTKYIHALVGRPDVATPRTWMDAHNQQDVFGVDTAHVCAHLCVSGECQIHNWKRWSAKLYMRHGHKGQQFDVNNPLPPRHSTKRLHHVPIHTRVRAHWVDAEYSLNSSLLTPHLAAHAAGRLVAVSARHPRARVGALVRVGPGVLSHVVDLNALHGIAHTIATTNNDTTTGRSSSSSSSSSKPTRCAHQRG